jgi:hypothetical protein
VVVLDEKLQNITGGKYIAALHKEADGYGDCCVMSVLIEDHLQFTGEFFCIAVLTAKQRRLHDCSF